MANRKSILQIEIEGQDKLDKVIDTQEKMADSWEDLQDRVAEYNRLVGDTPTDSLSNVETILERLLEKMEEKNNLIDRSNILQREEALLEEKNAAAVEKQLQAAIKAREKKDKELTKFQKTLKKGGQELDKIVGSTLKISKNVIATTASLAKWGVLAGVGIGGGGFFGFGAMANSSGNIRKESQGVGEKTGALESARINYKKLLDNPDALIKKISDDKSDLSNWNLRKLTGIDNNKLAGMPSTDIINQMLPEVKRIADGLDPRMAANRSVLDSKGLQQFSTDEIRRIREMSTGEVNDLVKNTKKDAMAFGIDDESNKKLQSTAIQFDRATKDIENSFKRLLVQLADPITQLSGALTTDIKLAIDSGKAARVIGTVAKKLEEAANYLVSDKAKQDFSDFSNRVGRAATAIESFVDKVNRVAEFFGLGAEKVPGETRHGLGESAVTIGKSAATGLVAGVKESVQAKVAETGFGYHGMFKPMWGKEYAKGAPAEPPAENASNVEGFNKYHQIIKQRESGGKPLLISTTGAIGTMGTLTSTLGKPGYGIKPFPVPQDIKDRIKQQRKVLGSGGDRKSRDPVLNDWLLANKDKLEEFGKQYFDAMMKIFHDPVKAAGAYNQGVGTMHKAGNNVNALPEEGRKYAKFMEASLRSGGLTKASQPKKGGLYHSEHENTGGFYRGNPKGNLNVKATSKIVIDNRTGTDVTVSAGALAG